MELRSGLWSVKMQHAGEGSSEYFDASEYNLYMLLEPLELLTVLM